MPKWNQPNLSKHYARHPAGKDANCWQDLLGQPGRNVPENMYERESLTVCIKRWLEYEAEEADRNNIGHAIRQGAGTPSINLKAN